MRAIAHFFIIGESCRSYFYNKVGGVRFLIINGAERHTIEPRPIVGEASAKPTERGCKSNGIDRPLSDATRQLSL